MFCEDIWIFNNVTEFQKQSIILWQLLTTSEEVKDRYKPIRNTYSQFFDIENESLTWKLTVTEQWQKLLSFSYITLIQRYLKYSPWWNTPLALFIVNLRDKQV